MNPIPSSTEKTYTFDTLNATIASQFDNRWEDAAAYTGQSFDELKYPHVSVHGLTGTLVAKRGYLYRLYDCTVTIQAEGGSVVYARDCTVVSVEGTATGSARAQIQLIDCSIASISCAFHNIVISGSATVLTSVTGCTNTRLKVMNVPLTPAGSLFTTNTDCRFKIIGGSVDASILMSGQIRTDLHIDSCTQNYTGSSPIGMSDGSVLINGSTVDNTTGNLMTVSGTSVVIGDSIITSASAAVQSYAGSVGLVATSVTSSANGLTLTDSNASINASVIEATAIGVSSANSSVSVSKSNVAGGSS